MWSWSQRRQWSTYKPRNTKSSNLPPAARRGKKIFILKFFSQRARPFWHLDFELQASRTMRINFCGFKPPSLWKPIYTPTHIFTFYIRSKSKSALWLLKSPLQGSCWVKNCSAAAGAPAGMGWCSYVGALLRSPWFPGNATLVEGSIQGLALLILKLSRNLCGSWAQNLSVSTCLDYRKYASSSLPYLPEFHWASSISSC